MRVSKIIIFLFITFYIDVISADESDPKAEDYSEVEESFGNVSFSAAKLSGLFRPALWGAFTYKVTNAATELLQCCGKCIADKQDPNINCVNALQQAGHAISIGVFGVSAWANGALKRDLEEAYSWGTTVAKVFASNSSTIDHQVILHKEADEKEPEHVIIYSEELGGHYNMSYHPESNSNGIIRINQINQNSHLAKREKLLPICIGQIDADYCRNLDYLLSFDASGWGDMADAVGKHMFPDGETSYDYNGWTAAYWKTYIHDNDNANWQWYASWRIYYTRDGITPIWTKCDDGH